MPKFEFNNIKNISGLLLCLAFAQCNRHPDFDLSVYEDGKLLKIKFEANKEGKRISYRRSFDIRGLSKIEKAAIVDHILDSLGVKTGNNAGQNNR